MSEEDINAIKLIGKNEVDEEEEEVIIEERIHELLYELVKKVAILHKSVNNIEKRLKQLESIKDNNIDDDNI
jgi:hypothetical protein